MALLSPAARQGTGPLARLMREGGLYCVFQPLADLREGSVYAHEALIRGPQGTPLHTPDALLELARREGILQDFELLCVFRPSSSPPTCSDPASSRALRRPV